MPAAAAAAAALLLLLPPLLLPQPLPQRLPPPPPLRSPRWLPSRLRAAAAAGGLTRVRVQPLKRDRPDMKRARPDGRPATVNHDELPRAVTAQCPHGRAG